jgi:serine/threonine protein kinase
VSAPQTRNQVGRYQIISELGRGGAGTVYKAYDPTVARTVAIKVMAPGADSDQLARFRNEARATGNLRHQNIVTIYESGEQDGTPYIVMEYLDGEDLVHVQKRKQKPSVLEIVSLMIQVAEGIEYAHSQGVVHRDVKPGNIILLPDGTPKIMDFGIARLMDSTTMRLTQTGLLIGTVLYMAPEQLTGDIADQQADIFAYGIVFYELLTGVNPFKGNDVRSTMYRIVAVDPDPPSKLAPACPLALDSVVMRTLEKDRDLRYQSLADVRFDLEPIRSELASQHAKDLIQTSTSFLEANEAESALNALKEALRLDPSNPDARALRERILGARGAQPQPAKAPEPPPLPVSPVPVPQQTRQPDLGEFTRMFERREPSAPSNPGATVAPRPTDDGGSTELFSAPGKPAPPQSSPPPPPASPIPTPPQKAQPGPGEFTRMFGWPEPSDPSKPGGTVTPRPTHDDGRFTGLFSAPGKPAPAQPSLPPPPPESAPGAFTRLLRMLKWTKAPRVETPSASPSPTPVKTPPAASDADVTRLFNEGQTVLFQRPLELRPDADTLARAQARELIDLIQSGDYESAIALRGKWLPGVEAADPQLRGFSEAARYMAAGEKAVGPHVRVEQLKRCDAVLSSVGSQLLLDASSPHRHLVEALDVWKMRARAMLQDAREKASAEIPNPFHAGQPLRPDQGLPVFRGREALVRSIEVILADANQSSSLALLGPRRCGKTSLLQMLPIMLPDCTCVFFDLQDNPVSTIPDFFRALARRAREQARRDRGIELPVLDESGSFEAAAAWLEELDANDGAGRFLICIDEFERLKDLFPGDPQDLLRLMGLFRATIQHRRRVRLLVSGVAPFEELGPLWNDHFINVRELRVGHLDEATGIDLLSRPIPEFPPAVVSEEVAARIYMRTGGQPYLLQLFGNKLVELLNRTQRPAAVVADVETVEEEALMHGRYYFANTFNDSPPDAKSVMEQLASGLPTEISRDTRRWLSRRCLLDDDDQLRIPVLARFIREEREE